MATLGEYIPNANTKGYWKLNGNSTDSSGNGNNGTDTSITYSQANGRFGQGAGFNSSSSKIALGNSSTLIIPNGGTISAWIKLDTTTSRNVIMARWFPVLFNNEHYYFEARNNGSGMKASVFLMESYGSSVAATQCIGTTILGTDWVNVIMTYDKSNIKIYVNGELDGTTAFTSTLTTSTANTFIGNDNLNSDRTFNGSIDEVIVENVAWSAEKVKKYYSQSKGRFGII